MCPWLPTEAHKLRSTSGPSVPTSVCLVDDPNRGNRRGPASACLGPNELLGSTTTDMKMLLAKLRHPVLRDELGISHPLCAADLRSSTGPQFRQNPAGADSHGPHRSRPAPYHPCRPYRGHLVLVD